MSKTFIAALVIVIGAAGVIYFLDRPEPTPQERLSEAAEQAGEAAEEAVEALSEAAQEVGEDLANSTRETAEDMKAKVSIALAEVAEQVARASEETQAQLRQFLEEWKAAGIMTEDGIDFAKAKAAVEASDLSADAKANVSAVLKALQDAPGAFEEKLDALRTLLNE